MRRFSLLLALSCLLVAGCADDPAPAGPDRGSCARPPCSPADTGRGGVTRDTSDTVSLDDVAADSADDPTADTSGDTTAEVSPDVPVRPDTSEPQPDTDGDGIVDALEGAGDFDEDGLPNFEDPDSDGDGIPDAVEYRREPGSGFQASDIDLDGDPDFLDLDSDGDGLLDESETGCPDSTSASEEDSDGDGYIDMLEVAFGSDACDASSDITEFVDFFFELPYEGDEKTAELDIGTTLESGDVVFNMDVTGSMASAITSLSNSLRTSIIPDLSGRISDVGIGVSQFADFPCDGHGNSGDLPYRLRQRVTTDAAAAQAAVGALRAAGGGDSPESGYEALYQLASGAGRSSDCAGGNVPAFDPASGAVPGVADGAVGGAGFRDAEVRVVVHITDESSHARGSDGYAYGASRAEAYAALDEADLRVIGLAQGESVFGFFSSSATDDLRAIARETGAVVQPCAWGSGASRPSACNASQCCTGLNGAGRAPSGGECPLVFEVASGLFGSGGGVDASVISGIEALLGGTLFDITATVRRDEEEFLATGIDTTCFINGVVPVRATVEGCASDPVPADTDGDGVLDGFTGVAPGSSVTFEIRAQNNCVEAARDPQVFLVWIDLFSSEGARLGERLVTILVSPRDPKE